MAKDIKVIFHGTKAPSGKNTETVYMISLERKKQLEKSKMFDIEVLDKPKVKNKATKKEKK
tara:strand:- start:237 stop:419 length:183 start_codon:yes stop_codon:yes gene_type:complete